MNNSRFLATCWLLPVLTIVVGFAVAAERDRSLPVIKGAEVPNGRTSAPDGDVAKSNGFAIDWWSVDGGGGSSSGGDYRLDGTVGQPDAALLGGGHFALEGGYWWITRGPDLLFEDGFESGDTTMWSRVVGGF